MNSLLHWVIRHNRMVLLISLLVSIVGGIFTVKLYQNLRTDLEELLPTDARSVVDLHKVTGRMESTTNLAVLVFSDHPAKSKRFVIDLARALENRYPELIYRIEYRIDREIEFFKNRRALFLDYDDIRRVRDYIQDRIMFEEEIRNPLNIFSERNIPEPRLDFASLKDKYSHRVSSFTRFKDGFYATQDEKIRVVLVYLRGKASGIANAKKLRSDVDRVIAELDPKSYDPGLTIKYTGDVENLVEENASLVQDLVFSVVIVTLLVTLSLLIYYRSISATICLLLSLLVGTLATFGISFFTTGYLNANTAFMGSIVLGNGINFGIIILARYLEARRKGKNLEDAFTIAGTQMLNSTLTAALAAGLSYGSLVLTSFRGFHQFGLIGLIGMILCWFSAILALPAFLATAERIRPFRGRVLDPPRHRISHGIAWMVEHASAALLLFSSLLLAGSAVAAARYHGPLLESDTTKLRDKRSMRQGSGHLALYLDQIFERYISPVVILPRNRQEAKIIADKLKEIKRREGPGGLIAAVYSVEDFVPSRQREKIALLKNIRDLLTPSIQKHLSGHDKRLVREFLRDEGLRPFTMKNLPKQVLDRFREIDGSVGRMVLVEPIFEEAIMRREENQSKFIHTLRDVTDSVSPGTPVVGQLPFTVDIFQSIRHDGPRATLFAFLSVFGLVILLFRHSHRVFLTLASLLLGVAWQAGFILAFDLKINFFNFIALPITFGIGVDYGVNVLQRYRVEGRGSILQVIRGTGGAVMLASATTVIGYGSLLIAQNQGFVSFGRIAILGEFTCVFAAVVTLPAFLYRRDWRQSRFALGRLPPRRSEPERHAA